MTLAHRMEHLIQSMGSSDIETGRASIVPLVIYKTIMILKPWNVLYKLFPCGIQKSCREFGRFAQTPSGLFGKRAINNCRNQSVRLSD